MCVSRAPVMHAKGFVKNHHRGPRMVYKESSTQPNTGLYIKVLRRGPVQTASGYYGEGPYRLHQGTVVLWLGAGSLVLTDVFGPLLSPLLGLLLSLLRAHQVWRTGENKSFRSEFIFHVVF